MGEGAEDGEVHDEIDSWIIGFGCVNGEVVGWGSPSWRSEGSLISEPLFFMVDGRKI